MIYWLFTDGRELLGSLLIPLSCLTLLMPLIVSAVFGAGIQRSSEIGRFGQMVFTLTDQTCYD